MTGNTRSQFTLRETGGLDMTVTNTEVQPLLSSNILATVPVAAPSYLRRGKMGTLTVKLRELFMRRIWSREGARCDAAMTTLSRADYFAAVAIGALTVLLVGGMSWLIGGAWIP